MADGHKVRTTKARRAEIAGRATSLSARSLEGNPVGTNKLGTNRTPIPVLSNPNEGVNMNNPAAAGRRA